MVLAQRMMTEFEGASQCPYCIVSQRGIAWPRLHDHASLLVFETCQRADSRCCAMSGPLCSVLQQEDGRQSQHAALPYRKAVDLLLGALCSALLLCCALDNAPPLLPGGTRRKKAKPAPQQEVEFTGEDVRLVCSARMRPHPDKAGLSPHVSPASSCHSISAAPNQPAACVRVSGCFAVVALCPCRHQWGSGSAPDPRCWAEASSLRLLIRRAWSAAAAAAAAAECIMPAPQDAQR